MATSNNELIRVEHAVKEFDGGAVKALNDCNLSINRGEVVAIIGPSGSGKSTLLRCLNLLEVPTSGSVWFDGVDITDKKIDLDLHRRKMGMVFQHFNLFPNMTVLKNLTLAPLSLYFKDSRVKVELGLCKGKKLYDKRDADAQRSAKREIDRTIKEKNY